MSNSNYPEAHLILFPLVGHYARILRVEGFLKGETKEELETHSLQLQVTEREVAEQGAEVYKRMQGGKFEELIRHSSNLTQLS